MKTTLTLLVCLLLASSPAAADPPNLLAYEGVLMLDNALVPNDARAVTFELYATEQDGVPVYTETQQVTFVNGRFSVLLGNPQPPAPPLDPGVFAAPEVWMGIRVGDTALAGRQRIVPVPYALWSGRTDNLQVARNLTVGGNAEVAGTTTLRGNTTMVNAQVDGDLRAQTGIIFPARADSPEHRVRRLVLVGQNPNPQGYTAIGFAGVADGSARTPMLTPGEGFCFLTYVNHFGGDGNGSNWCSVYLTDGRFQLWSRATTGTQECSAACIRWD